MIRREFLQAFATAVASGCVSGIPVCASASSANESSWKASFAAALKRNPWLIAYKGAEGETFPTTQMAVQGIIPERLRGVFYRNGPGRHEIGDMRYHHWFDGDGMVQAFRFTDSGVTHQGRYVQTQKYVSEKKAGKALEQGFGTALPFMKPVRYPDAVNVANINVIEHNGELLALWEGGSAYRLDQESLETLGLKSWSQSTKGLPFSAHPRVDHDGTLWNFGYSTVPSALVIYRINRDGSLHSTGLHHMASMPMIHDFMVTDRYLIFVLPPFEFDVSRHGSFLDRFEWEPEKGGRVLIVEKDDLTKASLIDVPAFWVFHFANAYEDGGQNIRFQAPLYDDPSVMTKSLRDVMRGEQTDASQSKLASGFIDLSKKRIDFQYHSFTETSEFPCIDSRHSGLKNRYTFLMQGNEDITAGLGLNQVMRLDNEGGAMSSFSYPSHMLADEHIFVADPEGQREGQGWCLGTVLDYKNEQTSLNVFDAEHIEDGPLATLRLDYPIPLGLHGNFVPA